MLAFRGQCGSGGRRTFCFSRYRRWADLQNMERQQRFPYCWQLVCLELLVQQHSGERNCREFSAHPAAVPVMHEPLAKPPTCCAALPGMQSP